MFRTAATLAVGFAVGVALPTPSAFAGAASPAATIEAKSALDRVLPDVKFTGVALKDCFEFLRDVSGANIHVNWRALEAAGVTPDTSINLRLRNISLRKVIGLLASEGGAAHIAFYVDGGVIEVTTKDLADKLMITRVYNVEDLLMEIPEFEASTSFNLSESSGGGSGGSGPGRAVCLNR